MFPLGNASSKTCKISVPPPGLSLEQNKGTGCRKEKLIIFLGVFILGCFFLKAQFILTRHALNAKSCAREVSATSLPLQLKKLRHRIEGDVGKGIAFARVVKAKGKEVRYVTVQGETWLPIECRSRAGKS